MTYSTSTPPYLIAQGIGGTYKLWHYDSTDGTATVDAAGYITNGSALGMTAGDSVVVLDSDASPLAKTIHTVSTVTAGSSADLSDGVAIGSTNSD